MTKWKELLDFDINSRVALVQNKLLGRELYSIGKNKVYFNQNCIEFNPCNDSTFSWPIINNNRINISWVSNESLELSEYAHAHVITNKGKLLSYSVDFYAGNVLRAAMIVFLMLNE